MKTLLSACICFVAMLAATGAQPCSNQNVRISVKFVLDAANNRPTSGAYITDDQVRSAIAEANEALERNGANWRIDLVEILDVPGISQWFGPFSCFDGSKGSMEAQAEANPNLYLWRTDAVNYYVISSLSGCGGVCSFPAGGDEIILINSQGILGNGIGWLHELGHYFNLTHTFEPNPAPVPCGPGNCSGATCPDVCPDTFNVMSYNCNMAGNNAVLSSCQLSIMASEMNPTTGRRHGVVYCADAPPPRQPQTITFPPLGNKTYGDPPLPISATASSGLPVSFSIVSGPATIAANAVRINGGGMVTVRASQSGNSTYLPAPDVDRAFTVLKANQVIQFGPLVNRSLGEPPFRVDALTSSGLPVAFSILSGPATMSGSLVTVLNPGTVTVRASQPGDANYNPAPNMDQPFSVYPRPPITILLQGEHVLIAWPTNVSGYVLESAPSLAPSVSWHAVLSNPVVVDGRSTVTLSATSNLFYRLRK